MRPSETERHVRKRGLWLAAAVLAVAALAVTACAAPAQHAVTARVVGPQESNGQPAWWSYNRPAEYHQVVQQIQVPVSGGTKVSCQLSLPGTSDTTVASGRFPGILENYYVYASLVESNGSAQGTLDSDAAITPYFAEHGYAVLDCELRGTGASGGVYPGCCERGPEPQDGADLIEWMARQPWSTGHIGMDGTSYGALSTLTTAALHPAHLDAIAPEQPPDNLYFDFAYPGGIQSTTDLGWPALVQSTSGNRVSAASIQQTWDSNPNFDSYWQSLDFTSTYAKDDTPTLLLAAGPNDQYFRRSLPDLYPIFAPKQNTWIITGPWLHGEWQDVGGDETQNVPLGALLDWFDYWLMNKPGSSLPPQSQKLVAYQGPAGVGAGWQTLDDWPPSDVRQQTLYLGANSTMTTQPGAAGQQDYVSSAATLTTTSLPHQYVQFLSAPLSNGTALAGQVKVQLQASLDDTDGNFYAQLYDVAPDGTATYVQDGQLKASHRTSFSRSTPVTPGAVNTYSFDLSPIDYLFQAGHRIEIRFSGGGSDYLEPADTRPVTTTLHLGGSGTFVRLPVRSAGCASTSFSC
jgi:uncharacterized protein